MPKMTKLRISNLKFDNGNKLIGDQTYDFEGLHTLKILQNGGGKTTLIHSICQVILGDIKFAGRRYKETIANKSTVNVAIEWSVDNQPGTRFLTGICMYNGDGSEGLKYFQYTLEYNTGEKLNIETLPFVKMQNGRRELVKYEELKTTLKDLKEDDKKLILNIYDATDKKKYRKDMREHGVLFEEWQSIVTINNEESSNESFFDNAKTTSQLLKNILIPVVAKNITVNEKNSTNKQNFETLNAQRSLVTELNEQEKDIKDFEYVQSTSKKMISATNELFIVQKEQKEIKNLFVRLHKSMETIQVQKQRLIEEIEKNILDKDLIRTDLKWKIESSPYNTMKAKEEQQKMLLEGTEKRLENVLNDLKESIQYANELQAIYAYNIWHEKVLEIQKIEEAIRVMEMSEPELQSELKEKEEAYKQSLSKVISKYTVLFEESKKEIEKIDEEIADCRAKSMKYASSITADKVKLEEVKKWFATFTERKRKVTDLFSEAEVADSVKAKNDLANEIRQLKEDIAQAEESYKQKQQQIETLKDEKRNMISTVKEMKFKLGHAEKEIAHYEKKEAEFKTDLSVFGIYVKNPLLEQSEILAKISSTKDKLQEGRDRLNVEIGKLKEEIELLNNNDYFSPNKNIEKMKSYLKTKGILVITGSEWLSENVSSEQEKENYMKNHPLLPYSLLVNDAQVQSINNVLKKSKEWNTETPYLFINKSSLNNENNNEEASLNQQMKSIYVFQPFNANLFSSKEEVEKMKKEKIAKLEHLEVNIQEPNSFLRGIAKIENDARIFFSNYDSQKVRDLHLEKEKLVSDISIAEEEKNAYDKRLATLEEMKETEQNQQKNMKEKLAKTEESQFEFKKYYELFIEHGTKKSLREHLEKSIVENEQKRDEWSEKENKASKRKSKKEKELYSDEFKKKTLLKEISKMGFVNILEGNHSDKTISELEQNMYELKNAYKVIRKQLEEKLQEREGQERLKTNAQNTKIEQEKEIKSTGISFDWLKENAKSVTWEEKEKAKKEIQENEQKKEELMKIRQEQKDAYSITLGSVKTKLETIQSEFGKDPYLYNSTDTLTSFEHQRKTVNLELKELQVKLEVVKREMQEEKYVSERLNKRFDNHAASELTVEFQEHEWKEFNMTPKAFMEKIENNEKEIDKKCRKKENNVVDECNRYTENLKTRKNPRLNKFIQDIKGLQESGKIFDYEHISATFEKIDVATVTLKEQTRKALEHSKKGVDAIIEMFYKQCEAIYKEILEIPKASNIQIYNKKIKALNIKWDIEHESDAKRLLKEYVTKILLSAKTQEEKGVLKEKIDKDIKDKVSVEQLINIVAPFEKCKITAYKPTAKEFIETSEQLYYDWDVVGNWSGGEEYSVYMMAYMLIMLNTRRNVSRNTVKPSLTVLADNPFGKASSDHVVQPFLEIANKNNIQVICLTAHDKEEILNYFPVIYSSRYYNMNGTGILNSEKIESMATISYREKSELGQNESIISEQETLSLF